MDPLRPLELLIAYSAIVIPLGTAVVSLLVVHFPSPKMRSWALLFWLGSPALLFLIAVECARLAWYRLLPTEFAFLVFATCFAIACGYLAGGRLLVVYMTYKVEQDHVAALREEERDHVRMLLLQYLTDRVARG